jgi:hypothetical protein
MPLKLKGFESKGDVAALNRWADEIEARLPVVPKNQNLTTVITNLTARISQLEKKAGLDE